MNDTMPSQTPNPDAPPAPDPADDEPAGAAAQRKERVAKVIARAGVTSRRGAEALIEEGRVKVNGVQLTTPAVTVGEEDAIAVDGLPLPRRLRTRAFLFHKPRGLVTTNRDPDGRPTVFDALPASLPRVVTVGRLDINTEGLLILTNDGGLARVMELPATGWTRRYRVRVHGAVDEGALESLKEGTVVDGMLYGPIEASIDRAGDNSWLTLALQEGKNREVKVVLGALGLTVTRLIRVSFGPFRLGDLPRGEVKEVPTRFLKEQLGPRLAAEAGADFDAPVSALMPRAEGRGSRRAPGRPMGERNEALQSAGKGGRPARGLGAGGGPKRRDAYGPEPRARPARREEGQAVQGFKEGRGPRQRGDGANKESPRRDGGEWASAPRRGKPERNGAAVSPRGRSDGERGSRRPRDEARGGPTHREGADHGFRRRGSDRDRGPDGDGAVARGPSAKTARDPRGAHRAQRPREDERGGPTHREGADPAFRRRGPDRDRDGDRDHDRARGPYAKTVRGPRIAHHAQRPREDDSGADHPTRTRQPHRPPEDGAKAPRRPAGERSGKSFRGDGAPEGKRPRGAAVGPAAAGGKGRARAGQGRYRGKPEGHDDAGGGQRSGRWNSGGAGAQRRSGEREARDGASGRKPFGDGTARAGPRKGREGAGEGAAKGRPERAASRPRSKPRPSGGPRGGPLPGKGSGRRKPEGSPPR
ncbi:MAG: pseudouridine synthase [Pseudomonadota bacterium]